MLNLHEIIFYNNKSLQSNNLLIQHWHIISHYIYMPNVFFFYGSCVSGHHKFSISLVVILLLVLFFSVGAGRGLTGPRPFIWPVAGFVRTFSLKTAARLKQNSKVMSTKSQNHVMKDTKMLSGVGWILQRWVIILSFYLSTISDNFDIKDFSIVD